MPPTSPPPTPGVVLALPEHGQQIFLAPVLPRFPALAGARAARNDELAAPDWTATLRGWAPRVLVTGWGTPPLPAAWLAEPDCPLRYVCHVAGSVRALVPRDFLARGGLVTNWGELVSPQVAEHGLMLALAALRNLPSWPAAIAASPDGARAEYLRTRTLHGGRVGLHGFGSVARALVPLLRPFGVTVSAYSAGVPDALLHAAGVAPAGSLAALFAGADVLFECEALTDATRGTVTAEILAQLPDDAVFVNIGRGDVVDDAALRREAVAGRLRLALDVVTHEPVTPGHPYAALPYTVLSPHIGGPTFDRYAACGARALGFVAAYLAGEAVPTLDLAGYDRAT